MVDPSGSWAVLGACMLNGAAATAGQFVFSFYSLALKEQFELTQEELETIGFSPLLGAPFVFLPGMLSDRVGPAVSTALGGIGIITSFILQWLVVTRNPFIRVLWTSSNAVVVSLSCFSMFYYLTGSMVMAVAMSSTARHFREGRGIAVGCVKAWTGLSSGLLIQIFVGFVKLDRSASPAALDIILMVAVFAAVGCIFSTVIFKLHQSSAESHPKPSADKDQAQIDTVKVHKQPQFYFACCVITITLLLVAVSALIPLNSSTQKISSFALVAWCFSPMVFAFSCWKKTSGSGPCANVHDQAYQKASGTSKLPQRNEIQLQVIGLPRIENCTAKAPNGPGEIASSDDIPLVVGKNANAGGGVLVQGSPFPELSFQQMICTRECWMLMLSSSAMLGAGFMVLTNAGQIFEAKGHASLTPMVVSLFSICQTITRIFIGALTDQALQGWRWRSHDLWLARPLFLVMFSLIMALGHGLMMAHGMVFLMTGVALVGLAFGIVFPMLVLLTADLFGLENHSANYIFFDGVAAMLGSLFLAKFLPERIYNAHVPKSSNKCIGDECFYSTHLAIAVIQVLSCVAAISLTQRSAPLFHQKHLLLKGSIS